jgi:tetratricopeptide (TPR) repeat protein
MNITFQSTHLFLRALVFAIICSGCVSTAQKQLQLAPAQLLLNDAAFSHFDSYSIEQPTTIFALGVEAKAFVAETTRGLHSENDKIKALIYRIFAKADLDLIYEASANTIANESFRNGAANCLSMSIMTFAMAKEAGFESEFQIVDIPEYWTRRDGYSLLNNHINLRIKSKSSANALTLVETTFVVDFDPSTRTIGFATQHADEQTVLAMFYNNKGVDALLKRNNDLAYAYLREAILTAETYSGAWANLGLLYKKKGLFDLALLSYARAINLDTNNNTAWENLAVLHQQLGDEKAALDIYISLDIKRRENPFYHQMLAEIEVEKGSFERSIMHYQTAIKLNNNQHQFYFGLASVYFEIGDFKRSQRFFKLAKRKAGKSKVADIYVDKLTALSNFVASTIIQ